MHPKLREVLEHRHSKNVLLGQHSLHFVRIVKVFVNRDEFLLNLLINKVNSQGETAELISHLCENVCRQD